MRIIAIAVITGALVAAPLAVARAQQSSPPSDSSSARAGSPRTGVEVAANTVIGAEVRDSQGKEIGSVSQLMIDPSQGKVTSVLIKQGGTLGIGGREIAMPWDAVKVQRDGNKIVVTVQQQMLEPVTQDPGRQGGTPAASPSTEPQSPGAPQPRQ